MPAGALVAEAEDALVVGHDDEPHVHVRGWRSSSGTRSTSSGVSHRPRGPAEDVAVLLAGAPDGRRVDHRQEFLDVLGEHAVEERCVAILERGQADVLLQLVVLATEVLDLQLDLLLDRHDAVREQATQAERIPLRQGKGEVLRQHPARQKVRPRHVDLGFEAGGEPVERSGEGSHRVNDSGRRGSAARATRAWAAPRRLRGSAPPGVPSDFVMHIGASRGGAGRRIVLRSARMCISPGNWLRERRGLPGATRRHDPAHNGRQTSGT